MRPYAIQDVDTLLEEEYGLITWRARMDPMAELVLTILSQHTSDLNSERAFQELHRRLPLWEMVLEAPVELVADAIRVGGLGEQKAPRIQAMLREVLGRCGEFDISFLLEWPLAEAKAWLRSLPGVGPKTAAVVLCFSLGMPAFPVDTHIYRVTRRLALIGPRVSVDEAHDVLEEQIEPGRVFSLHMALITHGRRVCKAQRPLCTECVLAPRCPSRDRVLNAR